MGRTELEITPQEFEYLGRRVKYGYLSYIPYKTAHNGPLFDRCAANWDTIWTSAKAGERRPDIEDSYSQIFYVWQWLEKKLDLRGDSW